MGTRATSRAVKTADLRKRATELRLRGATYQQIGDVLGVTATTAFRHVTAALDAARQQTAEDAEKVREIEVRRLDRYLVKLEAAIDKAKDSRQHIETAVKVAARRAALLGLDAPTKVAPTTPDGTEAVLPPVVQVVLVRPGEGSPL